MRRCLLTPSTLGKLAGILIFYTPPLLGDCIPPDDIKTLKTFYEAARGETCPMIVRLRDCNADQVARRSWDAVASRCGYIRAIPTAYGHAKLNAAIEELCIEHVEVKPTRLQRAYEAFVDFFASVVHWPGSLGEALSYGFRKELVDMSLTVSLMVYSTSSRSVITSYLESSLSNRYL